MSLDRWDTSATALLVLDCQNDFCRPEGAFSGPVAKQLAESPVVARISDTLESARRAGLVVIHVRHLLERDASEAHETSRLFRGMRKANACVPGSWGAEIIHEVTPAQGERIIDKHRISAFAGTALDRVLRQEGVNQLLLAGVATSFVVEGTARDAVDRGYRTLVVADACVSLTAAAHERSISEVLSYLAEIADSVSVTEWLTGQ